MLTFLNDRHIGAIRSAGTTPQSQFALRTYAIETLSRDLPNEGDVLLGGDLFNTFSVPAYDVLRTYEVLADWLSHHPSATLYNMAGNHDLSKTSTVMSSFQLLGKLLSRAFGDRYVHIEQPREVPYGYAIPHVRNQELFDLEISRIPRCRYLFLHCNFDNNFAAQSDHSLNFSREQLAQCPAQHLVFAHEHHTRHVGNVIIPGVQSGTSISDWLNPAETKSKLVISELAHILVPTEVRSDMYLEVDYSQLATAALSPAKFIRVVGSVPAEAMSRAISAVNRVRASSEAFVVANGLAAIAEDGSFVMTEATASVSGFDIMQALREFLTADEISILEPFYAEISDAH